MEIRLKSVSSWSRSRALYCCVIVFSRLCALRHSFLCTFDIARSQSGAGDVGMRMRSALNLTLIASEHVRQGQRGGVLPTRVRAFNSTQGRLLGFFILKIIFCNLL